MSDSELEINMIYHEYVYVLNEDKIYRNHLPIIIITPWKWLGKKMGVQRRMLYTQFRIVISAPFARADLPSDCTCPWNQMAVLAPRPALASDGDNHEPSINLNVTNPD